jgi:ssRNA-specific RNase YbeY (16S rRNA maturation enzyme)
MKNLIYPKKIIDCKNVENVKINDVCLNDEKITEINSENIILEKYTENISFENKKY